MRQLLGAGADPNRAPKRGFSPLMAAAMNGHAAVIETLLGAGADRDAVDDDDRTAAYYARRFTQVEALAALGMADDSPST